MSSEADNSNDRNGFAPGASVGAGRFTLLRQLGRGGMGVVWLARDERLREEVALKFLTPEVAHDASALEDMRRETLKSRKLSHPNIVRIHDLFEAAGEPAFIAMEFIEGKPLSALKAQQPERLFTWDYLKPLVRQLCDALDYAHRSKVIHRDLKPANMMLNGEGNLKLADFGIAATAADSMNRVTRNVGLSGTPAYMSPQQLDGEAPRATDDIYALGATLYELLTSKPPFYTGDILSQVRNKEPKPLTERLTDLELSNDIPGDVSALVMACLAKDPARRPASVAAFLAALSLASVVPPAAPAPEPEPPPPVSEVTIPRGMRGFKLKVVTRRRVEPPPPPREPARPDPRLVASTPAAGPAHPWRRRAVLAAVVVGVALLLKPAGGPGDPQALAAAQATAEAKLKAATEAAARQTAEEARLREAGLKTQADAVGRDRQATLKAKAEAEAKLWKIQANAKKASPWINSLGMKFVPVAGTDVLFSVWDVRVQDFEAFVKATGRDATAGMLSLGAGGWMKRGDSWKSPGFVQTPTHPVCGVSWEDAFVFAKWLTEKERKEGRLTAGQSYRLPQDWEWSVAVGLNEAKGETPMDKDQKIKDVYPWGNQWPPPNGAGNYAGEGDGFSEPIKGFRDGFPGTSPVGSFNANKFGLYDMGGNLWQWCEDRFDSYSNEPDRVLRGGAWIASRPYILLSSRREKDRPDVRSVIKGFRLVMVVGVRPWWDWLLPGRDALR